MMNKQPYRQAMCSPAPKINIEDLQRIVKLLRMQQTELVAQAQPFHDPQTIKAAHVRLLGKREGAAEGVKG